MNERAINPELSGEGAHVGIAVANWNRTITDKLLEGARKRCAELDVAEVTVVRVPGALELPLATKKLAHSRCDVVVAIGAVVKGETDHYETVVRESAAGIAQVALETGVPIGNAILAVHDFSQAIERAGEGDANKGVEAVEAVLRAWLAFEELEQI